MAGSLNKVMIIGNLGRDPELRYTQRGTPVCNFTVAVNRPGRTDEATGQRSEDETEWFAVVAWDKLAETCSQFLAKGRKVYIEGRLQTRSWEGQDGQKRSRVEVLAQQMVMLDPRQQGGEGQHGGEEMALAGAGARSGGNGRASAPTGDEDDLPF
jgi:single-strand DNA-binding protein